MYDSTIDGARAGTSTHTNPLVCEAPIAPGARAKFPAPAGTCDCHAHVFEIAPAYPFRPARRYTPADGSTAHAYAQMLRSLGITRAVVVQPDIYLDNRVTLDGIVTLGRCGIDARGVALVDPDIDETSLHALHAGGIRGVRVHLRRAWPDESARRSALARWQALAERLAPLGWHMQLHVDGRLLPGLTDWLGSLPVPAVLDHFGRVDLLHHDEDPGYRALLDVLRTGKCWVKLSAFYRFGEALAPYHRLAPAAAGLTQAAPERLLWGTDWPHSSIDQVMPTDADLLDTLAALVPDEALRHGILVDNPARLYGFGSVSSIPSTSSLTL